MSRLCREPLPKCACTPSWGGYYTLAGAQVALGLGSRIAELRAQGGRPMISYGGQRGPDLAVDCVSPSGPVSAYLAPIRQYGSSAIDLDVEGTALSDTVAGARRATAIATLERAVPRLAVWLTLPVCRPG